MAQVIVQKRVGKSAFVQLAQQIADRIGTKDAGAYVDDEGGMFLVKQRTGTGSYGRALWETVAMVSKDQQNVAIHVVYNHLAKVEKIATAFAVKHQRDVKIYKAAKNDDLTV